MYFIHLLYLLSHIPVTYIYLVLGIAVWDLGAFGAKLDLLILIVLQIVICDKNKEMALFLPVVIGVHQMNIKVFG